MNSYRDCSNKCPLLFVDLDFLPNDLLSWNLYYWYNYGMPLNFNNCIYSNIQLWNLNHMQNWPLISVDLYSILVPLLFIHYKINQCHLELFFNQVSDNDHHAPLVKLIPYFEISVNSIGQWHNMVFMYVLYEIEFQNIIFRPKTEIYP